MSPRSHMYRTSLATVLALSASCLLQACAGAPAGHLETLTGPLLRSDDPAELVLETDLEALRGERFEEGERALRPGTLRYRGPDGVERSLPVRVRGRGDSRRRICDFPPLLLVLPDSGGGDPVFGSHRLLHHVGHCRDEDPGFDALATKEYLAYRIYDLLAPESFRARLVRIRYRNAGADAEDGGRDRIRAGFVVEDRARLAERVGGRWLDNPAAVDPARVDLERSALVAVFQYMIGNTDWGIPGLHNVMLLETADGRLVPVPFDFDFSGLVDAPYARPDPRWGVDSVRERVFLGCRTVEHLGTALERIRERASAIVAEARSVPGLDPETRAEALAYLESFLDGVRGDGMADRLEGTCADRRGHLFDPAARKVYR